MASDDGYVYVDDSSPRVSYSDGWQVSSVSYALNGTFHVATQKGITATLKFTGTWVSVVGGGGDTNEFGLPSLSYTIDGKPYPGHTSYEAKSADTFYTNITFFNSPDLSPGEHTLVITNLHGTAPNTFCLDYIWYLSSEATGTTSTTSDATPTPPSQPTKDSMTSRISESTTTSLSLSSSTTSLSTTSSLSATISRASLTPSGTSPMVSASSLTEPAPAPAPSETGETSSDNVTAGASGRSQNLGAIIGGSIGGAVLFALLAVLCVYLFLKRRLAQRGGPTMYKIRHDRSAGVVSERHRSLFSSVGSPHTGMSPGPLLPTTGIAEPTSPPPTTPNANQWTGRDPNSAAALLFPAPGQELPTSRLAGMFRFKSTRKARVPSQNAAFGDDDADPFRSASPGQALPPPYTPN